MYLASAVETLREEGGFGVTQTSDFDLIASACRVAGKPYTSPFLDHMTSDLSPANCFWIIIYQGSNPVAVGGVRYDDMRGDTAEKYWGRMFARHYEGGISAVAEPLNSAICGRTCYLGDLFVSPGVRGSLRLLGCAARITHTLASIRWTPDVTYSFLRRRDVERGGASRYGYSTAIPYSKRFLDPKFPRTNDEFCAYLTKDEFEHTVRCEASNSLSADSRAHL